MSRRLCALVVVALILAAIGSSPTRAEERSQRVVRLGYVSALSPATQKFIPFWERLREMGWVEGRSLVVESRSAEGKLDRLPALMADVIDRKVDVLVTYGTPGGIAAKKATSTVPIVAWALSDPIRVCEQNAELLIERARNHIGLQIDWPVVAFGAWCLTTAILTRSASPVSPRSHSK